MNLFNTAETGRPTRYGRIFRPVPEWLALGLFEDVLEPALSIVDAHHHLWDKPGYPYLLEQFADDLGSGHNIVATVHIECDSMHRTEGPVALRPVGETEHVEALTRAFNAGKGSPQVAAAIVGHADLTLGSAVEEVLEAHLAAGNGRFRGIRYATGWDQSPEIGNSHLWCASSMLKDAVIDAGLRKLVALDLSLDVWVFHPQLGDVADLASRFPELRIVLGHCGGPLGYGPYQGRRDEVFAQWRASMTELARHPGIVVKLGGMMMRLAAFDYLTAATPPSSAQLARLWQPYIETCIELFGVHRCMAESNFPVEKMGVSYCTFWNALKTITSAMSQEDKKQLYQGTATRIYRL